MPSRLIRPLLILTAVALLAAGCSDAHTEAQRNWVDTGIDPDVLNVLAPPELSPVLNALDQAFLKVRPDTAIVFISQIGDTAGKHNNQASTLTNTQIIQAGASPSLWVDTAGVLKPFAKDSRAQGPIRPFGIEPMVLAVKAGNPAQVHGLDAFAAGGPSTGRCSSVAPCGKLGSVWLAQAKIKPDYQLKSINATKLLEAIAKGQTDAGLVLALDIPSGDPAIQTVPVPTPPAPTLTYRMLVMSPNPTATQFENWVASSPEARAILVAYGLVPGDGKAST